jgi:3-hydroxypropanoate dehydrogenase
LRELAELFPNANARSWFDTDPARIEETAFRNGTLQGAYLILAARSLGLDVGPMSGFDSDLIDATFFAGMSWRTNFLVNLGYGDSGELRPRLPRLPFATSCRVL